MAQIKILTEELDRLSLSSVSLDDDGALDTAIPRPTARLLTAALESRGVEASWAPDHENRDLAWVYVTIDGES